VTLNLQVLRHEVKHFGKKSPRLQHRLLALIELTKFREKWRCVTERDMERIGLRFEVSARTLFRWEAAYKKNGITGLTPRKSPGRCPNPIRGHVAKKIREMRKLFNWGAEVIQAHLKHDHDIQVSRYKINRYLAKQGLLVRKKCKPRNKHTKIVQVEHPGEHTQTDVKHLPWLLANRKKCYVYNFVDHASKWAFKWAYDSYGPQETKDFMNRVVTSAPFAITRLQSDNGVEFTFKYVTKLDDPSSHA
jgi:transposase